MIATRIEIADEAHWHALRLKHVGGSEVAALFGCSPYTTAWALWQEKAGRVERRDIDNPRTRWGRLLEPLIASEVSRTLGWKLTAGASHYHSHPTVTGMGATLDYEAEVDDPQKGRGVLEIKTVFDYATWAQDWSEERAPACFEVQLQHQLAVTGREWGAIACFVMQTATLQPLLLRDRQDELIADIENRVGAFWASIKRDDPPDPLGTAEEADIIKRLYPARAPGKVLELDSQELAEAAEMLTWTKGQKAGIEREHTRVRTLLLAAAKDAELLKLPGFNVRVRQTKTGATYVDAAPIANTLTAG